MSRTDREVREELQRNQAMFTNRGAFGDGWEDALRWFLAGGAQDSEQLSAEIKRLQGWLVYANEDKQRLTSEKMNLEGENARLKNINGLHEMNIRELETEVSQLRGEIVKANRYVNDQQRAELVLLAEKQNLTVDNMRLKDRVQHLTELLSECSGGRSMRSELS